MATLSLLMRQCPVLVASPYFVLYWASIKMGTAAALSLGKRHPFWGMAPKPGSSILAGSGYSLEQLREREWTKPKTFVLSQVCCYISQFCSFKFLYRYYSMFVFVKSLTIQRTHYPCAFTVIRPFFQVRMVYSIFLNHERSLNPIAPTLSMFFQSSNFTISSWYPTFIYGLNHYALPEISTHLFIVTTSWTTRSYLPVIVHPISFTRPFEFD